MFISVTKLRLRSVWRLPAFMLKTMSAFNQAKRAPGNLFAKTENIDLLTYGTLTAWESAAAMRAYRNSGPHLAAMKVSRSMTVLLQSTHFEAPDVPSWADALARMDADPKSIKFQAA